MVKFGNVKKACIMYEVKLRFLQTFNAISKAIEIIRKDQGVTYFLGKAKSMLNESKIKIGRDSMFHIPGLN